MGCKSEIHEITAGGLIASYTCKVSVNYLLNTFTIQLYKLS